jgi:uncharacterized protein YdaU (DUF1376 family)
MNRPWMPFYVPDYLGDTGHLSTLEHGAYMLLIMHYWMNGGLPEKEAQLARIVRLSVPEWQEIAPTLRAFFHDGWKHKRVEEELADSAARYERRAKAGKKGGDAKAGNPPHPSNATAMLDQEASNAVATRGTRQPQLQPQPHCSDEQRRSAHTRTREDLDHIEDRCREAAGAQRDRNAAPALRDLRPILAWLDAGFSLEEDILPVIRAKAPRSLGSWAYFAGALRDALDASARAVQVARQAARSPPGRDVAEPGGTRAHRILASMYAEEVARAEHRSE